jgi:hypothetical protein
LKSIVEAFRGPSFHLLIHTSKLGLKKDIDHLVAGTHGFKSIVKAFRGSSFHLLIHTSKLGPKIDIYHLVADTPL